MIYRPRKVVRDVTVRGSPCDSSRRHGAARRATTRSHAVCTSLHRVVCSSIINEGEECDVVLDVAVARNHRHGQRPDVLFITRHRIGGLGLFHAAPGEYTHGLVFAVDDKSSELQNVESSQPERIREDRDRV